MISENYFQGRVALIAGGTGGLGTAVSLAFSGAGATVVTTYQRAQDMEPLVAEAKRAGKTPPSGVPMDTTDAGSVNLAVQQIVAAHGRLDILVNTVGGYAGGKNVWEEDPATYQRMMNLNLLSGFLLARGVLPAMIRQNRGAIVNINSRAAYGHAAGGALYAASKAAALALFDSIAEEVKPYAVNVNSVVPSIIDTAANRREMPSADFASWPKPADIAQVILFLCSDEARLIHGAAVPVYGRT
jgi:NAD(P)-dependent dehydrogenase (short-subunit alcohol dehydrogenase family)